MSYDVTLLLILNGYDAQVQVISTDGPKGRVMWIITIILPHPKIWILIISLIFKRLFSLELFYDFHNFMHDAQYIFDLLFSEDMGQMGPIRIVLILSNKKIPLVLWNWYHQNDRGIHLQYICYFRWPCYLADSWHSYGCQLFSPFRRFIPLPVRGRSHTGSFQEKKRSYP